MSGLLREAVRTPRERGEERGRYAEACSRGVPISAGWKISAETRVQTSEIIRSLPMLAVPGWRESQRLPKPVAVVSAEKNTARARLEVRRGEPPALRDITKEMWK